GPYNHYSPTARGAGALDWERVRRRGESRCLLRDSDRGESSCWRCLFQSYRGFSIKKASRARAGTGPLREGRIGSKVFTRVVLVTGACGGLGGELVRAFVQEGARVVAHFSEHPQRAEALAHELGSPCVPLGADLTLEADVERLFAEIEAGLGPVDVLVANAG